jgi:hypothetical protein
MGSIKICVSIPLVLWNAACDTMPGAKASHIVQDALQYLVTNELQIIPICKSPNTCDVCVAVGSACRDLD